MTALWTQIAENLSFVLTCLALVVGLALLAKLAEHFLPERRTVNLLVVWVGQKHGVWY